MPKQPKPSLRIVALLGLAAIAACAPIKQRHGYVPTGEDLAQLTPGVTMREDALTLLPAPSAGGISHGGNLYYVSNEFHALGPFNPREVRREVVAITFAPDGRLTGVERYGLQDGQVVPLLRRVTRDNVADMSFIRQLIGNVGRFDPSALLGGS